MKKIAVLFVCAIASMFLCVGYAQLSSTLRISGSINVDAATYDIYFTNVNP